ncbi:MAG: hypothetical protein AAF639_28250 [Chloroflexota bacterium]
MTELTAKTQSTKQRRRRRTRSLILTLLTVVVLLIVGTLYLFAQTMSSDELVEISGIVLDEDGPVGNASVRVQATEYQSETASDGSFTMLVPASNGEVTLVAARLGYFLGWANIVPNEIASGDAGDTVIAGIELTKHHDTDSLDYEWEPSINCAECHPSYDEWKADAHSQTATNHRFLTMYQGTDVEGNKSPRTNYDLGLPRTLDLEKPYYGPGFKVDFPKRDGNCASCHTPMAASFEGTMIEANNTCGWVGCHMYETIEYSDELGPSVVPVGLTGVAAEGISCDFCHKVGDVHFDPETGLPDHERTGILSLGLYRPDYMDERFIIGSIDDVSRDTDTFNSLHKQSEFCASCHFSVFNETPVYNSYGEWLDSDYSDAETGQSCQDCHMPMAENYDEMRGRAVQMISWLDNQLPGDSSPLVDAVMDQVNKNYFVYPEKEGLYRDPNQVHNHTMPGASDADFLQNAVTMMTNAEVVDGQLHVSVDITNDQTGHHVPTGSPLRHVMLVVQATDSEGNQLALVDGSVLPEWTGNYADQPGKAFAKILRDDITGAAPTFEHWRNISIDSDTRIAANATDVTEYVFDMSGSDGMIAVDVKLIFRRAFQQLMEWKGWDDPDILMEEEMLSVSQ